MLMKLQAALVILVILAGCSSATGPTFSAWSVNTPGGAKIYRVSCYGLFEGAGTCEKKAQDICGTEPVRVVQADAPLGSTTSGGKPNTRILTFQCGAPAPEPAAVAAAVVSEPRRMTLQADANFDFDQATLTDEGRSRLDKLLSDANGMTFSTVEVSGYTDWVGTDAYNQRLSERRAQTVAQYLREHGLQAQAFDVHGYGKSNPVATNSTAEGRAQNRRVELVLSPAK